MIKRKVKAIAFSIEDKHPLQDILVQYDTAVQNGFEHLTVECSFDSYGMTIECTGERLETDEEYEARLKLEAKIAERTKKEKEKKLAAERAQYNRLKKKFEKLGEK
jgi:hypothetical protein